MLERQSALMAALQRGGRDGADGKRRCRLGEVKGWMLTQVAGFSQTMAQVEQTVEPTLGELPLGCRNAVQGETVIFRTGPEQLWIVSREGSDVERRLTQAIDPAVGAVTPLSHSRTRIFIEGDCAAQILMKHLPLDFDARVFKPGQAALTGFHHTPVLIHRLREDRFEIYALRTFALSVWEVATDAALEFGYDVASEAAA